LMRAVLDEGAYGRLTTLAGVVENRREIFILKKEFLRTATQLPSPPPPPAAFLLLTLQKRGLCRLEVTCDVKFSYCFGLKRR
jgi:hypothetical protein